MKRGSGPGLLRLREKEALEDWTFVVCHGIMFLYSYVRVRDRGGLEGVVRDYGSLFDGDLLGFRGPDGPLITDDLLYFEPMFNI